MRRVLPYQRVLAHGRVVTLEERGNVAVFRLGRVEGDLPITRHEVEFLAVMLVRMGAFALDGRWRLDVVHFEHAAPGDVREYARVFRCPVHFERRESALVVPLAVIQRRLPHYCDEAVRALEAAADERVRRLAVPTVAGDVRARVLARLRANRTMGDVDEIAAELHLSARTLQRRLGAERASFTAVVEEARRDLAVELVEEGATLERVARAVGFSGTSALVRAFRRWTGRTPAEYRAQRAH